MSFPTQNAPVSSRALRKPSAGIIGAPTLHNYGSVTTAQTIDASTADVHYMTLGANIAITVSTQTVPDRTTVLLWLTQDGTGSRTITSWTGVTWLNGIAPTLRTTAAAYDLLEFTFVNSLTTWVGRLLTNYSLHVNSLTVDGDSTFTGNVTVVGGLAINTAPANTVTLAANYAMVVPNLTLGVNAELDLATDAVLVCVGD